ncbi:hypothetical protein MKZ38_003078 [Zalerion maritima]|uniref:RING-type E3 ubiquitin transferase n=1 Tax=Zalerion maritima TaxID=339359 RepID=A0AAD5RN10_9PEZI|nr:hypothetical protein MKZ38_003078 [Zalerion maritima]
MAAAPSRAVNPLDGYKVAPRPALPHPSNSPFPYATAPDIIRAQQKDQYFQGFLAQSISDVHRRILGARSAHAWAAESKTLAALIYLGLTTLLGHQTLGEEYCDIIQAHPVLDVSDKAKGKAPTGIKSPTITRRATYILGSIIVPYLLTRSLPKVRSLVRTILERYLARAETQRQKSPSSRNSKAPIAQRIANYILTHLGALTDPTHVHALSLATFYFTGSYYELSKRFTSLRYIFARTPPELATPSPSGAIGGQRGGYEVLGVLLALQMTVQGYQHLRSVLSPSPTSPPGSSDRERPGMFMTTSLSQADDAYASNTLLLPTAQTSKLITSINTPLPAGNARYDLEDSKTMKWMKGSSVRKCTLCLESMRDPAATSCGHVFCWECICDWVKEKPECPLCRRDVSVSHVLPLRGF